VFPVLIGVAAAFGWVSGSNPAAQGINEECKKLVVVDVRIEQKHLEDPNTLIPKMVTEVCMGQPLVWHFYNATQEKVKIEFADFKQDKTNTPTPDAVKYRRDWFDSDKDGKVEPGDTATLIATVGAVKDVCVKYTIRLKGSSRWVDHDPRLEITDPPVMLGSSSKTRSQKYCTPEG
jgi:hypothetical protein